MYQGIRYHQKFDVPSWSRIWFQTLSTTRYFLIFFKRKSVQYLPCLPTWVHKHYIKILDRLAPAALLGYTFHWSRNVGIYVVFKLYQKKEERSHQHQHGNSTRTSSPNLREVAQICTAKSSNNQKSYSNSHRFRTRSAITWIPVSSINFPRVFWWCKLSILAMHPRKWTRMFTQK